MAGSGLIACPDCGRQVSKKADACPNCGREIRGSFGKRMLKGYLKFVLVSFGLLAGACMIWGT